MLDATGLGAPGWWISMFISVNLVKLTRKISIQTLQLLLVDLQLLAVMMANTNPTISDVETLRSSSIWQRKQVSISQCCNIGLYWQELTFLSTLVLGN